MQECTKCGQMVGKGFYMHEKYCNGTPKPKKEHVEKDLFGNPMPPKTKTVYPEPEPEPEHIIEEARIVHKSDLGMGAVIVIVVIFAGIIYILIHAKDIIPALKAGAMSGDVINDEQLNNALKGRTIYG